MSDASSRQEVPQATGDRVSVSASPQSPDDELSDWNVSTTQSADGDDDDDEDEDDIDVFWSFM